ncbi:MAG: ParB N-terminal domain-containing protein [Ignavibacteriaceae bacterium]|nr:ParB N-terminal domain-containing protein [Ignavibacteriaceae bacterium]
MKYDRLPISQIELDKTNPRIAHWLKMYTDVSQEQLYLALGVAEPGSAEAGPSFFSLKEAIKTNNGVIHPILVNKKSNGKYMVIEGNTRLAIYMDFQKNKVDGDWTTIPCIIHENLSEAQVDAIRLQAHLVGVRQWQPYAKARYLKHLRDSEHLTWNQVVDYCGGKSKENQELIAAYEDMEQYYRKVLEDDSSFDETRFSAFVELQKPRIKEAIINSGNNLNDFSIWVRDRKISRLENVRRLPAILSDKRAKELFMTRGDKAALALIDSAIIQTDQSSLSLIQVAKLLSEKLRKINFEEITRYKEDASSPELEALLETKDELISFSNLIKGSEQ